MGPIGDRYWICDIMDIEMLARRIVAKPEGVPFEADADALEYLRGVRANFVEMDEFPLVEITAVGKISYIVYFVGDIHGDLDTCKKVIDRFLKLRSNRSLEAKGVGVKLVFLGDYIDRAPKEIRNGGALTILYLLSMKYLYPDEIILLRGNHEAIDLLTFAPYELPMEIHDLFGTDLSREIHDEMIGIFSLLPLFVRTSNGVIASHAGFPRADQGSIHDIRRGDSEVLIRSLWGSPVDTASYRGKVSTTANFSEGELKAFLDDVECGIMIRGHDHNISGHSMYGGKLLTLISSSCYKDRGIGGVLLAGMEIGRPVSSVDDLSLYRISDGDEWEDAEPNRI